MLNWAAKQELHGVSVADARYSDAPAFAFSDGWIASTSDLVVEVNFETNLDLLIMEQQTHCIEVAPVFSHPCKLPQRPSSPHAAMCGRVMLLVFAVVRCSGESRELLNIARGLDCGANQAGGLCGYRAEALWASHQELAAVKEACAGGPLARLLVAEDDNQITRDAVARGDPCRGKPVLALGSAFDRATSLRKSGVSFVAWGVGLVLFGALVACPAWYGIGGPRTGDSEQIEEEGRKPHSAIFDGEPLGFYVDADGVLHVDPWERKVTGY